MNFAEREMNYMPFDDVPELKYVPPSRLEMVGTAIAMVVVVGLMLVGYILANQQPTRCDYQNAVTRDGYVATNCI